MTDEETPAEGTITLTFPIVPNAIAYHWYVEGTPERELAIPQTIKDRILRRQRKQIIPGVPSTLIMSIEAATGKATDYGTLKTNVTISTEDRE